MKLNLLLLLAVATTPALARKPDPITLSAIYEPEVEANAAKPGKNTVTGTAVMRTVGGDAKTCAAQDAAIFPVTAYRKMYFTYLFGDPQRGYHGGDDAMPNVVNYDERSRQPLQRVSCDADGKFAFTHLVDGEYFVIATVTWRAQYMQGGVIMDTVRVSDGETRNIVLAR